MMLLNDMLTIGELAAEKPEVLPVLQELGIDYCCGGKRLLKDALAEKRVSMNDLLARATKREAERRDIAERTDFTAMSPAVLTAYIEDTHHEYLRRTLPEIDRLLYATLRAHGGHHRELFQVYSLFGQLKADLEQHLVKEETLLFPALAQGDADAAILASEIEKEHEGAGELLRKLREVTVDYAVPEDACPTYRKVYGLLGEMENDLHQHIHLENNILLKGVL